MSHDHWQRVLTLFEQASLLSAEEREGFLRQRGQVDPGVEEEVRELLATEPPSGFLRAPAYVPAPLARAFGGNLEGQVLGDFRLLGEIGRGGQGVVYLAEQCSLGRRVAVKLMPRSKGTDAEHCERFRREARAASRLEHPNINPVFGLGESDDLIWFGMRYVDGHDLAEEVRRQQAGQRAPGEAALLLPAYESPEYVSRVVDRIADLADGIQYAHDNGTIHRDVKPQNIILDRNARMILVDFGLARNEAFTTQSSAHRIAGTLPYMSPEQGRVLRASIDHRTDIYSLCVVLYELLTLQRPFRGDNAGELLNRIAAGTHLDIRKLNPRIARDLAIVCEKGMARRPQDRYPTAAALSADLRRFLRHEAITARAPSTWTRLRNWGHKRRLMLAAGASLLAGLALTATYQALQAQRARDEGWKRDIDAALAAGDWNKTYSEVVEARRALQELRAAGTGSDELRAAALAFELRLADDRRQRVAEVQHDLEAARSSASSQERVRCLMAAVATAGRSAILHEKDEWLGRAGLVESVFPRISLTVAEAAGVPVAVSGRAIDPVTGRLGAPFPLGNTPIREHPIAPGDYRFSLRATDGRSAEVERDCLAFGEHLNLTARLFSGPPEGSGMVRIRGGEFVLGKPRPLGCSQSVDSVFVEDFYLDEAEVSNGEYLEFLLATRRTAPSIWREAGHDGVDWHSLPVAGQEARWLDLPVSGLSWEDARDYAEWMGRRLPTHLELEWALRGPELRLRPWEDPMDRRGVRANVDGPGRAAIHSWRDAYAEAVRVLEPVRALGFRHAPHELFHAFGNVQEWTSSKVVQWIAGRPVVHDLGRYYMGGAWSAVTDGDTLDDHAYTNIGDAHASLRVGFRCARSVLD